MDMAFGNSDLGGGIGFGAIFLGIGAGSAMLIYALGISSSRTNATNNLKIIEEERIEAQVEVQRLETIEELVKQFGNKMSPEEFKKYLTDLNLYKEK